MTNGIKINQTVAILCDGNNVERSIQSMTGENVMINWDTLIPKLLNGRGLNRLIYFREGKHISHKLAERLHEKFYGSVVPCHKSADIPLSIKATQLASKVDTIIIMSGDSDYVDLVNHLKSEGVRVEAAAVKANTARLLLERVDHFHEITKNDVFSYNTKKRPHHKDEREMPQVTQKESLEEQPKTAPQMPKEQSKPQETHAEQVISVLQKDRPKKNNHDLFQELAIEAEKEEKQESLFARAIKKVVKKTTSTKTQKKEENTDKSPSVKKKTVKKKTTKKK